MDSEKRSRPGSFTEAAKDHTGSAIKESLPAVSANPYRDAFPDYRAQGWLSVLPVPYAKKAPPPTGYTGRDAVVPSFADCQAWADDPEPHNIAVVMRPRVIGLDIDAYDGKPGAATLAECEARLVPLPATVRITARGMASVSGTRYYSVPEGTVLRDDLPGIDVIQGHHRYSVVWPSIHPNGTPYQWINEATGEIMTKAPALEDLAALPDEWLDYLRIGNHAGSAKADLTASDVAAVLAGMPTGEPCPHIRSAATDALLAQGSRHDASTKAQLAIVGYGRRGCPGAAHVLEALHKSFVAQVAADRDGGAAEAEREWRRGLEGALRIVATDPQGHGCPADMSMFQDDSEQADQRTVDGDDAAGWTNPYGLVQWLALFLDDDEPPQWLIPYLVLEGGTVSIYSPAGVGKSLLALEAACAIATGGAFLGVPCEQAHVLYVDHENDRRMLRERLEALGYGPDSDLSRLHYSLLGDWPPLDTAEGGRALLDLAKRVGAKLVIIDTLSRTVSGGENDADTYAALFRHTVAPLKRAGIASLRLDHAGKDTSKGQRGSSAKNSDIDQIYRLTSDGPGALTLKREKTRRHLEAPEVLKLTRQTNPLRHESLEADVARESKIERLVDALDAHNLPTDAGRVRARNVLKDEGIRCSTSDLIAAISRRKFRSQDGTVSPGPLLGVRGRRTGAGKSDLDKSGHVLDRPGQALDTKESEGEKSVLDKARTGFAHCTRCGVEQPPTNPCPQCVAESRGTTEASA